MEIQAQGGGGRTGDASRPPLRVHLLGRFEVVRDDAPIPPYAWRRRRPADLLKLVALAPGRSLTRQQVIDALWPGKDPASGANNLHRALYDLRQIVGGRWVDIEQGVVSLHGDVWVDVDAFEAAIRTGDRASLQQAAALYRGDLSPEDREATWLAERRATLRTRFVEAALPLARAAVSEGDAQTAVPLLRRIVAGDPTGEEAHVLLVDALAAAGRRAEALRQHDASEAALRAAGRPSDVLSALRAAVQRGEIGPARPRPVLDGARRAARRLLGTADPSPVRGRGPLLLVLEALAEQGTGAIVLLGEPGVGKTRLAVEAARLAQARGAAVLCGIGGTSPGAPYAIFADAFREEARVNPALPDPLAVSAPAGVAGERVRRAISEGVASALRAVADGRPPLLLLDDLHLADESSLNLLRELVRRARELELTVVATVSEEAIQGGTPIQSALAHLDAARLARGVRVPRLTLAGTREQIGDLQHGPAAEGTVAAIHRATDGSPLLVEQLVLAQLESGQSLPADAAAAIRARVGRLGPRAEALLGAASVCGARFEFERVRLLGGLDGPEAAATLEACLEARLVDDDGSGGFRFHHEVIRSALHDGLAPERRTALHGALADAVEAGAGEAPPPELVAFHRRRAGQEARAIRPLLAAGHRAAARAGFREALTFYTDALELSRGGGMDPADRRELLEACGRVQLALADIGGAVTSLEEAARLSPGGAPSPGEDAQRARVHRLTALALASAGRLLEARQAIERGVAAAERASGDGLSPLLELESRLRWHEGRYDEARLAARAAAWAAEDAGEPDLQARAAETGALAGASAGEPLDAGAATPRAEPAGEDPDEPFDVHLTLWDRDLLTDAHAAAVSRAAALLGELARLRGAGGALAVARSGEGAAALALADLDIAEPVLREALRGHREAGSALGEALALERLAALLTVRGRLAEALDALDEGIVVAERGLLRRHALVRLHATAARCRLAAGAVQAAEDAIREASDAAARHGECVACDAAFRPEHVRVLLLRGRLREAEEEAAQLEDIARRRGGLVLGAIAGLARARVLAASGRTADALASLGSARTAFSATGHRYQAARCARLEVRLRGTGTAIPEEVQELDSLVAVDLDA